MVPTRLDSALIVKIVKKHEFRGVSLEGPTETPSYRTENMSRSSCYHTVKHLSENPKFSTVLAMLILAQNIPL